MVFRSCVPPTAKVIVFIKVGRRELITSFATVGSRRRKRQKFWQMGSLMAGWDSPILDSKTVSSLRNRSLTREEIENFWKLQKKCEEEEQRQDEHNPPAVLGLQNDPLTRESGSTVTPSRRSVDSSTSTSESDVVAFTEVKKTDDWWTRSSWAFLNEPSHEETVESLNKYASQYLVAKLTTDKSVHAQ